MGKGVCSRVIALADIVIARRRTHAGLWEANGHFHILSEEIDPSLWRKSRKMERSLRVIGKSNKFN